MPQQFLKTDAIEDLLAETPPGALVLCDLDCTLICPEQQMGSDHWEQSLKRRWMAQGWDEEAATRFCHLWWITAQAKTRVKPVEDVAIKVVHELQNRASAVLGLTARSFAMARMTMQQLREADIFLTPGDLFPDTIDLGLDASAGFLNGILYSGWEGKGRVLEAFLEEADHLPKNVIFIDDREENLTSVAEALQGTNIAYTPVLYHAYSSDDHEDEITDIQWRFSHEVLPDEAAEILWKHGFRGDTSNPRAYAPTQPGIL